MKRILELFIPSNNVTKMLKTFNLSTMEKMEEVLQTSDIYSNCKIFRQKKTKIAKFKKTKFIQEEKMNIKFTN